MLFMMYQHRSFLTAVLAILLTFAAIASSSGGPKGYNQASTGKPTLTPTKTRREIRNHRDPVGAPHFIRLTLTVSQIESRGASAHLKQLIHSSK